MTTRATWSSPQRIDPFEVPLSTKLDLLSATVKEASTAGPLVQQIEASIDLYRDEKVFANTEGALIEQTLTESGGGLMVNAGNGDDLQRRSFPQGVPRQIRGQRGDFATAGWEHVESLGLVENAARVAAEAVALLTAPQCPDEVTTLIAGGNQLAMVLHECAGHPMEADRALGTEASLAGGTYATPERRGFRWGSPIVSAYADATIPGGLGSFGYDDEGVPAQRTQLIKDGIFLGYMSGRESAAALGDQPTGASRADGWQRLPLVRMTNICLEPGESSLEEMIAGTKRGILVDTNRGFSIDDQRMSFRFTTEARLGDPRRQARPAAEELQLPERHAAVLGRSGRARRSGRVEGARRPVVQQGRAAAGGSCRSRHRAGTIPERAGGAMSIERTDIEQALQILGPGTRLDVLGENAELLRYAESEITAQHSERRLRVRVKVNRDGRTAGGTLETLDPAAVQVLADRLTAALADLPAPASEPEPTDEPVGTTPDLEQAVVEPAKSIVDCDPPYGTSGSPRCATASTDPRASVERSGTTSSTGSSRTRPACSGPRR